MSSPVIFLTDFSDRLSPMLVKELRQGMRARSFTLLFLGFQVLLAFILLVSGASFDSDGAGSAASGIIFTMFSIAVLGIQPMRGSTALSSEITGNTIEMMVLTRLTAWRIVFGKWIAIVSQSALILTTIIPYLILRYFFGGMNLLGEMVFLCLIFLTSMALTAVMVGFSATATKVARVLPIFGIIMLAQIVPGVLFRGSFSGGMGFFALSDWSSSLVILCYVVLVSYFGWCALSYGTSAIAPAAENHSTVRRLVALVLSTAAAAVGFRSDTDAGAVAFLLGCFMVPALITALTEPDILLPPVCKPFLKRGAPGRIAAAFLLPGWPTGVFFSCILIVISFVGMIVGPTYNGLTPPNDWVSVFFLAALGSILFPALLAALFSRQENKRFNNFMLFLVGTVVVSVCAMMIAGMSNDNTLLWFAVWSPPTLVFMQSTGGFESDHLINAGIVLNLLFLTLLIGSAIMRYRGYDRIFLEAEAGRASGKISKTPAPTEK